MGLIHRALLAEWILLGAGCCSGQVISPEIYQTEEDLLEGLETGELTFDQYLDLLDLMRQKALLARPDSTLVLEIPDADYFSLDSADYDARERIGQFAKTKDNGGQALSGRAVVQHRQKVAQASEAETYFRIEAGKQRAWNFYLESENEDNQSRIKRRAIEFVNPGQWRIILGNFQPGFGLGVNVGNRNYLNLTSENSLEAENTFWFPFLTRYNGIYATYERKNRSLALFYSQNRFGSYKDQVTGTELSLRWRRLQLAPIFSFQEISRAGQKFKSRAGSLYAKLFLHSSEVSGEFALSDQQAKGAVLEAAWQPGKNHSFHLLFWSYTQDFRHPVSGGKAMPDYRSIQLEDLGLSFRSKQAGETGIYFSSLISPSPRDRLELAYEQWRDGNSFQNKSRARIGLGHWLKKNLEIRLKQYWIDDNLAASFPEGKVTTLVATYLFSSRTSLQTRLNYRSSSLDDGNRNAAWEDVIFAFPVRERLSSRIKVGYRDPDFSNGGDSYWNFYLSENIMLAKGVFLMAEFVSKKYQDTRQQDFQVLRIRMEAGL